MLNVQNHQLNYPNNYTIFALVDELAIHNPAKGTKQSLPVCMHGSDFYICFNVQHTCAG